MDIREYRRILIIKPGAIGDLLQLTPAIRALKQRYPQSEITIMVGLAGTMPLFFYNPHVSNVLFFDRKGEHKGFKKMLELVQQVRQRRYDLVVNFQRASVATWLLAFAAMPKRLLVYQKTRTRKIHAVSNHLEALAPLGIKVEAADNSLELHVAREDEVSADQILAAAGLLGRPIIAFNPGASSIIKCWSPVKYAQLADKIQSEFQVGIIVVGGPFEGHLYDSMAMYTKTQPLNLIGKTSLLVLGALLKRCICLVSGDTGPLHVATAVGTRVIALFGAIDPDRTGPIGDGHIVVRHSKLACVPCMAKSCHNKNYLECMESISVDEVFAHIRTMISACDHASDTLKLG